MIIDIITDIKEDFGPVLDILGSAIRIICIVVPIVLVIMCSVDFVKAITSNDDGALKKAFNSSIKRLIAGVLIFLMPYIVSFVMSLVDGSEYEDADVEGTYHPIIETNSVYL
ncbi:MAG: hypothetical protein PHD10_01630 [Bacilli bacterium]|nr:hypothetical protein [Bacilli bacterium]MDD4607823.1 hypothetical protein [Bacilli bacterium]